MLHTALFAAAVALLSDTGLGRVIRDPEQVALRRKLWELEGELWESEQEERQRIHRHHRDEHQHSHRHHRRPLLGLLRRRAMAANQPEPDERVTASEPKSKGHHGHIAKSRQLPSTHPAMRNLKVRQNEATDARANLEGQVKNAMAHLNSVAVIKSNLAKTEVKIQVEERNLKKLEHDRQRLDLTHRSLTQSLKRVMEPKLAVAEERLLKREHEAKKARAREGAWKQQEENFHTASLDMIKERDESKANLDTALHAEETAHHLRKEAEQQLGAAKRKLSVDIQNYRSAETEHHAAKSKEEHKEKQMFRSKTAVNRLSNIMHAEQGRVDESMAHGKDRVEGKIRELEGAKKKTKAHLAELEHEYAEWRAGAEAWKAQLASAREGTHGASQNYADAQEATFAVKREQIVDDAQKKSAWDEKADWADQTDWPGMDDKVDDSQNASSERVKEDTPMALAPASKAVPQLNAADSASNAPSQPDSPTPTADTQTQDKAGSFAELPQLPTIYDLQ